MNSRGKFTVCVCVKHSVTMVFNEETDVFYHKKGYRPRHIALFIVRYEGSLHVLVFSTP